MSGIGNAFTEAALRTLTAAFTPQIAEAIGEVLKVAKAYDDRLARIEAMVEVILMRTASHGNEQPAITDARSRPHVE
jgi:hypothetical protein